MFKYLLLIITYISASANPDYWDKQVVKQAVPIINLINSYRLDQDLYPIDFDYSLNKELELYKITYGNEWYEQNGTIVSYPITKDPNNTRADNGLSVLNYASYESYARYGYKFLFSIKNKKHLYADDLRILIRNSKECFDLKLCSKDPPFKNYISCSKTKLCDNRFFGRILKPSFSRISFIKSKTKTYFYGRSSEYKWDNPYIEY